MAVAGPLILTDVPLMVYETFGNEEADLLEIYRQSCRYPGNTICIMGLNRRSTIAAYKAAPLPDISSLMQKLAEMRVPGHDACIVPFKWKSVGGGKMAEIEAQGARGLRPEDQEKGAFDAADQKLGYTLPYYEVRGYLMSQAERMISARGIDYGQVLFRWIDRDVREDTADRLPPSLLQQTAADGEAKYISGTYRWSTQPGSFKKKIFMELFNNYERVLREKWFAINNSMGIASSLFYLPEPALIMNYTAHYNGMLNLMGAHKKSLMATKLLEGKQDQESMAAFRGSASEGNSIKNVIFVPHFSVSKPNKRLPGSEDRYLQELEDMIGTPGANAMSYENFCAVLSRVRQSAFNNSNWAFDSKATFREWYAGDPSGRIEALEAEVQEGNHDNEVELAQLRFARERNRLARMLHEYYKAAPAYHQAAAKDVLESS